MRSGWVWDIPVICYTAECKKIQKMRSCGSLKGQESLRWGSWVRSKFSWRSLFVIINSCTSSRCCSSISNTRPVSLACPNWGIDVWTRIRTELEFHLTERTEERIENLEKTGHMGTDDFSAILTRPYTYLRGNGCVDGCGELFARSYTLSYQDTGQLWYENWNHSSVTLHSHLP